MRPWFEPALDGLVRRGLALSGAQADWIRSGAARIVAPVIVLGLLKVAVGLSRGKPVGFLVALVAATAVAGMFVARVRRLATGLGERELSRLGKENARALRAPLPPEVLFAFAFGGAAALASTPFEGYAAASAVRADGGGCGGSDGGGGCGGCGGE